jgi:LuxR family transcriptional regulator, maltose regulon positive regulatory protein
VSQAKSPGSGQSGRKIIQRPRLTRLLDCAEARVVLLIGPAGYGKTTLAKEWLASRDVVWYRANAGSSDVASLASGLASAARSVAKGPNDSLRRRLEVSPNPEAEVDHLAQMLAERLAPWPSSTWLAVDDYQQIMASPTAEMFFDLLVQRTPFRLLIASRRRPTWVSARQLLYGEIIELGQDALAMSHEEAAEVLAASSDSPPTVPGLVALAGGWPALIGLAALSGLSGFDLHDALPETMHSYFAEELFQGMRPDAQKALMTLALAPTIQMPLAQRLFGRRSEEILLEGIRAGFLTQDREAFDLHPLLRHFLVGKVAELGNGQLSLETETVYRWYLDEKLWDDAFIVAQRSSSSSPTLLTELLEASLDELLASGRVATLTHWLEGLRRVSPSPTVVELTKVELLFRQGRWGDAETRATELAMKLPEESDLRFRALYRAGQCAHLDDRPTQSLRLLQDARQQASTPDEARQALWTKFIVLGELERLDLAEAVLTEFGDQPGATPAALIRVRQGHLHLAARLGGIDQELAEHVTDLDLLDQVLDPVIRTGFLQTWGNALGFIADYDGAFETAIRELEEAKEAGLDFVRPHGLALRAVAELGQRRFGKAVASIRESERLAALGKDLHSTMNATVVQARIFLAQGKPDRAIAITDTEWERSPSPGMLGDFLSTRALALACSGDARNTQRLIEQSASVSNHADARVLRAFAASVAAHLSRDPRADEIIEAALSEVVISGNYDGFVCAYRAYPAMLASLRSGGTKRNKRLRAVVRRVDPNLAIRARLIGGSELPSGGHLTRRELEVLQLLRDGLSNREIGQTLWISERTAKVHVRHIFEKLGVRSRTEAAHKATEEGLLPGSGAGQRESS